ncbi:MAG: ABC transporter ATP-binding protein [Alphaproteobacteria bacterium]|nr:ABC transporter ATP-binding protein [Alphaproteobacteria bacterium]
MLELREVTVAFGALRAVDGVSLDIPVGAIAALIGPNGAGKTTLFNAVAGAQPIGAGAIRFKGRDIAGLPPHRIFAKGLARTFQIPRPFAELSVIENLMTVPLGQAGERFWRNWLTPGAVRAEERRLRDKAEAVLDFVTLRPLALAPARTLSGGQSKLLELARVLMADPAFVLLDEPAAGVNPALLETIVDKIRTLNARGIGFLVIEHNIDLVTRLCHPIVVMAQGRVVTMGDAAAVRADPRVIEAYLGDQP